MKFYDLPPVPFGNIFFFNGHKNLQIVSAYGSDRIRNYLSSRIRTSEVRIGKVGPARNLYGSVTLVTQPK